ncbi:MAG: hypothetical protein K6A23_09945, partial [Butyrivibrio sp.]|nr:hypothetical protein [Butyrivibrio sp.]
MATKNEKKQKRNISFTESMKTKLIGIMIAGAAIPLLVSLIISYVTSTDKAMTDAQTALEWQANYIQS